MSDKKPTNLMFAKLSNGDAEYTPEAVLRSALTDVDDIEEICIVAIKKGQKLCLYNSQVNRIHLMVGALYDVIHELFKFGR